MNSCYPVTKLFLADPLSGRFAYETENDLFVLVKKGHKHSLTKDNIEIGSIVPGTNGHGSIWIRNGLTGGQTKCIGEYTLEAGVYFVIPYRDGKMIREQQVKRGIL